MNNKIFTELTIIFTIFKGFLLFYIVLLIYIYVFFVEQIGGEIIEELGDQREALERTRDRVKTISIYIHGFYNHKIITYLLA